MNMQTCFVNTDDAPKKREHICFFVRGDEGNKVLMAIERWTYNHPDAPEDANIQILQTVNHGEFKKGNMQKYAQLVLLEAAQNNIRLD